jgi:hypothetical protein
LDAENPHQRIIERMSKAALKEKLNNPPVNTIKNMFSIFG